MRHLCTGRLALEKALSCGADRERGGPRNGETADTSSEGLHPAARGLGACGSAKELAGSARMGLSPALLLVLALAVSGWPVHVAAVSTFTGESFDFMGQPGRYYSLINTPGVQVRLFAACSYAVVPNAWYWPLRMSVCQHVQCNAVFDEQIAALCRSPPGIRRAWATTPVRIRCDSSHCVLCMTQGTAARTSLTVHSLTDKRYCLRSFPNRGCWSQVRDRGC